MTNFFNQFYNESNDQFSLVIEDDGRVAYAYLLKGEEIIGDVWLYNQEEAPKKTEWKKQETPFLNPESFLNESMQIDPINNLDEVKVIWEEEGIITCKIFLRGSLLAIVSNGSHPGWSMLVSRNGPLAKIPAVSRSSEE